MAARPPCSAEWVDEIKHDGYRLIVHRDRPSAQLYSRKLDRAGGGDRGWRRADQGQELHDRPRGGCARARRLVTVRGVEPSGGRRCRDPLCPTTTARICAITILDRKTALARLLRDTEAGILFNEHHIVENSPIVFATPAGWAQRASFQSGRTAHIDPPVDARPGSRYQSRQRRCAARARRELER
jgi:hypothetical protein